MSCSVQRSADIVKSAVLFYSGVRWCFSAQVASPEWGPLTFTMPVNLQLVREKAYASESVTTWN